MNNKAFWCGANVIEWVTGHHYPAVLDQAAAVSGSCLSFWANLAASLALVGAPYSRQELATPVLLGQHRESGRRRHSRYLRCHGFGEWRYYFWRLRVRCDFRIRTVSRTPC